MSLEVKNVKRCLQLIFVIGFIFFWGINIVQAHTGEEETANVQEELLEKQMDQLGIEELQQYWEKVLTEYGGFLPEIQQKSLVDFMKEKEKISIKSWLNSIMKFAFQELITNGKLLGSLILLTIFSMLLQSLHHSFERGAVSKAAYSIVFMVLIVISLNSFHVAIEYTKVAIDTMIHFMMALLPLLLTLIATSGGVISASFFHPVSIFLISTSGFVIQNIVLPLLFLSALLNIVSTLSEHHKVSQLAGLIKNVSIGLLGVLMTVFLGVISVQGATSAVSDGIALRTAKFLTGNFVPVVGRMFTDAADTVISASVLLKNTLGTVGVTVILIITLFPAVKILIISFIYKLAAALLQPLGDGPVITCLNTISKSMTSVFAALAIVSFMFFLCITIMISAGNIILMMR